MIKPLKDYLPESFLSEGPRDNRDFVEMLNSELKKYRFSGKQISRNKYRWTTPERHCVEIEFDPRDPGMVNWALGEIIGNQFGETRVSFEESGNDDMSYAMSELLDKIGNSFDHKEQPSLEKMPPLSESFLTELGEPPVTSSSPISGGEAARKPDPVDSKYGTRELKIGDPVVVKNMRYEGKTGIVDDFTDNENYVIVDLKEVGKKKFNIADLEYDDYANQEEIDVNHELNNLRTLSGY